MLELDTGKCIRNTWEVLKHSAGEDQLDRSCEKLGSVTVNQGAAVHSTYNKNKKAHWIGHILRRNCLLKHVMEGKNRGKDGCDRKTRKKM